MAKPIAGVVFDLEGTVVDMEPAHHEAHIQSAKVIGVELTLERCLDGVTVPHFIGGPDELVAQEIASLTKTAEDIQARQDSASMFLANDKAVYDRLMREAPCKPRPGFYRAYLTLTNGYDLPAVIGSSTPREYAEMLLFRSELDEHFRSNQVVLGQKAKDGKAIPDVWVECAKRMDVSPDQLLVFEDSPRGIMGAVQVGATCIGMPVYNKPSVIQKLLEAGAARVFMDWREINVEELITNLNEERAKL